MSACRRRPNLCAGALLERPAQHRSELRNGHAGLRPLPKRPSLTRGAKISPSNKSRPTQKGPLTCAIPSERATGLEPATLTLAK